MHAYRMRREALEWCRKEAAKYPVSGPAVLWQDVFEIHKVLVAESEKAVR